MAFGFGILIELAASSIASPFDSDPADITRIGEDFDYTAQIEKLRHKSFPYQAYGKERRCFQLQWLQKFKWLEYSMAEDAVFCHICRQFGQQHPKEMTFTTIDYRHWNKANTEKKGFAKHEVSVNHTEAVARQIEKTKR